MNKTELASSVATRTSITKATADSAVAAVFATIAEALARGEKVSIAGFGTFATRSRPARQGRNPRDPMAFIYGSLFLIIQVSLQGVEFRVLFERHRSGRKTACLTPFAVARYA